MKDEGPGKFMEVEYGVRFTGVGNDGERGLFIEPTSSVGSAQGRCAMYRRKGDDKAQVVTRNVTTAWTRWKPLPHQEESGR